MANKNNYAVIGIGQFGSSVCETLAEAHQDILAIDKNGEIHRGYVTALYPHLNALNFQSLTKHCKKVNAKKCRLVYKFNNVYWF